MDKHDSTLIKAVSKPIFQQRYTLFTDADDDLRSIIAHAHSLRLEVLLKPHIDLIDDDSYWRGDIGIGFTDSDWNEWFDSYATFILHYATLAQNTGVEMLSISTELINPSKRDAQWRNIISRVRDVYSYKITDSANWGWLNATGGEETNKTWWDAVDIIGVDAYYPLTNETHPNVTTVITAWKPVIERLQNLSEYWGKPVILTEIGYCSGDCAFRNSTGPDEQAQEIRYRAAFEALKDHDDWFKGMFWWTWNTDPAFGGSGDPCISPQFKSAEKVLRKYYQASSGLPIRPDYPSVCDCYV